MTLRYAIPGALVAAFALFSLACAEPKFSPCKKDDDCSGKAHHCVQLKCLECRSDEDCSGGYCSFGVCKTLGGPHPSVTPESSAAPSAAPAPDATEMPEAPPP